jgi:hypothetical protein
MPKLSLGQVHRLAQALFSMLMEARWKLAQVQRWVRVC